jgi:hypothetical protein
MTPDQFAKLLDPVGPLQRITGRRPKGRRLSVGEK